MLDNFKGSLGNRRMILKNIKFSVIMEVYTTSMQIYSGETVPLISYFLCTPSDLHDAR
jgi:hypothetical protein